MNVELYNYGKGLEQIGGDLTFIHEINLELEDKAKKLNENIKMCNIAIERLKVLEVPTLLSSDHVNLINIFERLKNAYSSILMSVCKESNCINEVLFQKGIEMVEAEKVRMKPTVVSLLIKSYEYIQTSGGSKDIR